MTRFVHDFLRGDDNFFRGERGFFLLADNPPQMRVAVRVRALNVDDGDIGIQRRDDDHILAAVGISDSFDIGIRFFKTGRTRLIHWQERQTSRPRLQGA
jgi:hypothetical protein